MKKKIIIFGNSSSGKSTIAQKLCNKYGLAHLDLDSLAWLPTDPPKRRALLDSKKEIIEFTKNNTGWVIEGCYSDLIQLAAADSTEAIYMNPSIELCIENAKNRPWEPHKYNSPEAQDENLEMLIQWIQDYSKRTDTFSKLEHEILFNKYTKEKQMISSNNYEV